MQVDLTELVGQSLTLVRKEDRSWSFLFSGGDALFTEEPWRLMGPNGILAASEDDQEKFGLPDSVDSLNQVTDALVGMPVIAARHDPRSGDLRVEFPDGRTLEFLQLSGGYEAWRLHLRDTEFICLGGGALAEFPRTRPV